MLGPHSPQPRDEMRLDDLAQRERHGNNTRSLWSMAMTMVRYMDYWSLPTIPTCDGKFSYVGRLRNDRDQLAMAMASKKVQFTDCLFRSDRSSAVGRLQRLVPTDNSRLTSPTPRPPRAARSRLQTSSASRCRPLDRARRTPRAAAPACGRVRDRR